MKWPETLIPHFPWACRDLPSKGAQLPRAPHGSEGRSMGTGAGAGPYHPPDPPTPNTHTQQDKNSWNNKPVISKNLPLRQGQHEAPGRV